MDNDLVEDMKEMMRAYIVDHKCTLVSMFAEYNDIFENEAEEVFDSIELF